LGLVSSLGFPGSKYKFSIPFINDLVSGAHRSKCIRRRMAVTNSSVISYLAFKEWEGRMTDVNQQIISPRRFQTFPTSPTSRILDDCVLCRRQLDPHPKWTDPSKKSLVYHVAYPTYGRVFPHNRIMDPTYWCHKCAKQEYRALANTWPYFYKTHTVWKDE
jgi:hypothetical protein